MAAGTTVAPPVAGAAEAEECALARSHVPPGAAWLVARGRRGCRPAGRPVFLLLLLQEPQYFTVCTVLLYHNRATCLKLYMILYCSRRSINTIRE